MTLAALAALTVPALADIPLGTVKTEQASFTVKTVTEGLDHPWGLAFLPNGSYLVTERGGKLFNISKDGSGRTEIVGLPKNIRAEGQGGLFDVLPAPDYTKSHLIYFAYTGEADGKNNTEVARGVLDTAKGTVSDVKTIFAAKPKLGGNNHYGGKLLFGPDGKLYITLGERFDYLELVQKNDNHLGALIRINPDGSVPTDNPFVKDPSKKLPEAFTYGHRNMQGIALRPGTSEIWTHEHGPKGGDEINIVKAGANYGWPAITYGVDYSGFPISDKTEAEGMEQPLLHWTPSIAPSGMAFYTGDKFPQWKGDLFVGTLAGMHLRRLEIKGDEVVEQEEMLKGIGRVRDVRAGPDGFIYLLTDDTDGQLLRLEPAR